MDKLVQLLETELLDRMQNDEFFDLDDWFTFQYNLPLTVPNMVPVMNKIFSKTPGNTYYFKEDAIRGELSEDSDYIIYNTENETEQIRFASLVSEVQKNIMDIPSVIPK